LIRVVAHEAGAKSEIYVLRYVSRWELFERVSDA
jgi:hypothetical protein